MMGTTVIKIKSRPQIPIGATVLIPTVVLTNSESLSPAKNRNREVRRLPGVASANIGMYHPSFTSFIKVLPESRNSVLLEDMHVITNPLLNEDRQKSCQKEG